MGYALFTLRKLTLTSRINHTNAQSMRLSERTMILTQQISAKQAARNQEVSRATAQAYTNYQTSVDAGVEFCTAKVSLDEELAKIDAQAALTDAEIQKLTLVQTALDMERQTIETQLTAFQSELDSVKKAEESGIKNSTVKF